MRPTKVMLMFAVCAIAFSGAAVAHHFYLPSPFDDQKEQKVTIEKSLTVTPFVITAFVADVDYCQPVIVRPATESLTLMQNGKVSAVFVTRVISVAHAPPKDRYRC